MIDMIIPMGEPDSGLPVGSQLSDPRAQSIRMIEIGAIAKRMGLGIDVASAVSRGMSPDAVAAAVFAAKAEADEATAIIATLPAPSTAGAKVEHHRHSGLVAEARRSAAETLERHRART